MTPPNDALSKELQRVLDPLNEPMPFLSSAVRWGDLIFVSGVAAYLPGGRASGHGSEWRPGPLIEGGIREQTHQTLEKLSRILSAAGTDRSRVLKVNGYLREIDRDFADYNEVYLEFFRSHPPARTTVQATIYGNVLVEIDCVAVAI